MSDGIVKPKDHSVILTNGSEVVSEVNGRQITRLESSLWYLVDDHSDFYKIYESKDIPETLLIRGKNLAPIDPDAIPVAIFHKEEYRWRNERGRIVLEYAPMDLAALCIAHDGKAGITEFIEALPERSKTLTDGQLRALIYETELLAEEISDVISPKQEYWLEWIREILLDESDARWLIRRLQDRRIVKLEGGL